MSTRMMFVRAVAGMAACVALGGRASTDCDFKPLISYVDGCEEFRGPARGYAPGGWVVFQPEGLPKWHGAKACNTTLWELSRFSGGREQKKKRPPEKRVGKADIPLTDAMKADVRRYLEETRRNGGSLIVRIGYTWSDSPGCEPSDFDEIDASHRFRFSPHRKRSARRPYSLYGRLLPSESRRPRRVCGGNHSHP